MTSRAITAAPARPRRANPASCVHHWLIEAPVDMTSRGRCVRCGAEREFTNRYVAPEMNPTASGRFGWPRDRARDERSA